MAEQPMQFQYASPDAHPTLGEPIEQLQGSYLKNARWNGLYAAGAFVLFCLCVLNVERVAWDALAQGRITIETLKMPVMVVLAGMGAVACMIPTWRSVSAGLTLVTLYSRGLWVRSPLTYRELLWDDVTSVVEDHVTTIRAHDHERVSTRHILRFSLAGGRKFVLRLSDFDCSEIVSSVVAEQTVPRLAAAAWEKFQAEGRLKFGPIAMTTEGLVLDRGLWRSRITWDEVKKFKIDNGDLVIWTGKEWFGDWCRLPVARIPDFRVLLVLMENMIHGPMPSDERKELEEGFEESGSMVEAWQGR